MYTDLGENDIFMELFSTLNRSLYSLGDTLRKDSCISYCTRKSTHIQTEHKNNLMNILYRLSQRENKLNWTEEEQMILQATSDFISNYVNILIQKIPKDAFQYVLIVPSNCTRQLKDNLIRPLFIRSNLISIQDHRDRLLFFSDLECIFYHLQDPNYQHHVFSKYVVLCKITPIKRNSAATAATASIQLDLVQTNKSLFTHPNSKQVPNVIRSKSVSMTSEDIKSCLKSCVKEKLYPGDTDAGQYNFMELAIEYIYNRAQCQKKETDDGYSRYDDTDKIYDASTRTWIRHGLKKSQKTKLVRSIRITDICQKISESLYQSMKDILSNIKEAQFLVLEDQYSSSDLDLDPSLLDWLKLVIEQARSSLSNVATLTKISTTTATKDVIHRKNIIAGASSGALEFIQNSDVYNKPRILSIKENSSVFLNSKLNAIINIDISIKSTLLSCALINEDGLTTKVFDNTYFTTEMSLPSLGSFYDFSKDKTILNVNDQFIALTKQYLKNDISHFPMDEENKQFLYNMESILNNSAKETTTSTQKQEYIRFFLFMYMINIKKILSKLPSNAVVPDKIGYVISIEKIVLDNVIGTKSDFQELIFATGLLEKDDRFKKLRVITYGEGLLPMIQKYHSYDFPVKSYFLLAQLHEEYIQLTLNQVVVDTEEVAENEESMIVQEEIIPIQNIYDTLCLDIWDHATSTNDRSLIRFCDKHNNKTSESFLMENKYDFTTHLKRYLADNIFKDDSKGQLIGKHTLCITNSCKCTLYLTMNDIIDISLKPALQEIARNISSSLINKRLFGNYTKNTLHLSILIYFNSNILLHPIISNLLKTTIDPLHRAHKFDTSCSIIPTTFPTQIYQPMINQPSFFYSLFQTGTFQQVFSSSYIVVVNIVKNTGTPSRKGPEKTGRATTRPRSMTFSNPPNLTDIKRLRESTQITTSILEQDDQKALPTSTEHVVPQWEVGTLNMPSFTSSHLNDAMACSSSIEKSVYNPKVTTTLIERLACSKPKQNYIENMASSSKDNTKTPVHVTQQENLTTRESLHAYHKTIATAFLKQESSNKKKNARIDNIGSFLLIQGEELKNNSKIVHVRRLQKNLRERVSIVITKLKTSAEIGSTDNIACKFSIELASLPESFDYHRGGLPLLISVKRVAYSSTLEFWVSVDGTEYNEKLFEVLEPLALVRV